MAARIADRAQIEDVRLLRSTAELVRVPTADFRLTYRLETGAEVEYENGDDSFVVKGMYRVAIAEVDPTDSHDPFAEPDAAIATLDFDYAGLFSLHMSDEDDPPDPNELMAYAASTGQFALYPYVREYIYDVTGRLSLPPLTVGVLRIPVERPE